MAGRPTIVEMDWPRDVPGSSERIVKSAGRIMRILEHLASVREPTSVVEVAEALGYPPSSTAALLRTLVELGYLQFQAKGRVYCPTSRVPLIGAWMNSAFFGESNVLCVVRRVSEASQETTFLAMAKPREIQIIHVLEGENTGAACLSVGATSPVVACAAGHVALTELRDADIVRLALRYNAENPGLQQNVSHIRLLEAVRRVRETHYASSPEPHDTRHMSIATKVPHIPGQSRLIIGVNGPIERLRSKSAMIISAMNEAIKAISLAEHSPRTNSVQTIAPQASL